MRNSLVCKSQSPTLGTRHELISLCRIRCSTGESHARISVLLSGVWTLIVLKESTLFEKDIFCVSLRNVAEDKLLRAGRVGQLSYHWPYRRESGAIFETPEIARTMAQRPRPAPGFSATQRELFQPRTKSPIDFFPSPEISMSTLLKYSVA